MPPGAGFSQPHKVLQLQVMLQLGSFLGAEASRLFALNQFCHALLCRFGRTEGGDIVGAGAGGNEINHLLVRSLQAHRVSLHRSLARVDAMREYSPSPLARQGLPAGWAIGASQFPSSGSVTFVP